MPLRITNRETRLSGIARNACLMGFAVIGLLLGSPPVHAELPEGVRCHFPAAPAPPPGRDIVIVLDASGSMMPTLPLVINEVKRTVNAMRQENRLVVITFSGRGVEELPAEPALTCLPACTPTRKAVLRDWLSLKNHAFKTGGSGAKYAKAAIEHALSYEPDLVFVLSDGTFGRSAGPERFEIDPDSLIAAIHEQNQSQNAAKINTIQFVNEDPLARAGQRGTLIRIAEVTGGTYKYVSERDLSLR